MEGFRSVSLYAPVPSTLSRWTFGATTALSGYFYNQSLQPPNAIVLKDTGKSSGKIKDTLSSKLTWKSLDVFRVLCVLFCCWQGLISALPNYPVAPQPFRDYPLNPTLLTWNPLSAAALLTIIAASLIRLLSFKQLGQDFTFQLRRPSKLNKSGIYKYVQHPSYTGAFIAYATFLYWFMRCDGAMGTMLPVFILDKQYVLWNWLLPTISALIGLITLGFRVKEEEDMLKRSFGNEWERWHRSTARFIPYLI